VGHAFLRRSLPDSQPPRLNLDLPGPVLLIGNYFPPLSGGSPVVMRNLLQWFDPTDYIIATESPPKNCSLIEALTGAKIYYTSRQHSKFDRVNVALSYAQILLIASRISKLARQNKCAVIVGVFPELDYLYAAYLVHRWTGLPLVIYLHDTIIENYLTGYRKILAKWLQPRLFKHASLIWVMSHGMTDMLRERYHIDTTPLVHCFNETIPGTPPPWHKKNTDPLKIFFSGNIYTVNEAVLTRIVKGVGLIPGVQLNIYGGNSQEFLMRGGLLAPQVQAGYLRSRKALLDFMATQDVFVLGLSWPQESSAGEHELKTAFPTKIPEYLAQGKPIIVHCPEDYFLGRFFREHQCGLVVSTPAEHAITQAVEEIKNYPAKALALGKNALKAARIFQGYQVARQFQSGLQSLF